MTDRLALFLSAVVAALVIGSHGPVYWDSFGYVTQSLTGQVGGLALGRPLFILVSHLIARGYLALGGSVWNVEPWLRTWWMIVSATAAPASYALAIRCGLPRRGALIAGLALAVSPAMAHTSAAVLTDMPAVALVLWALVVGARVVEHPSIWRACAAGGLVGAAFGVREPSIVSAASLVLMLPLAPASRRGSMAMGMAAGAAVVIITPIAIVVSTQAGYLDTVANWYGGVRRESAAHTYSVNDAVMYGAWLLSFGPIAVAAAVVAWTRRASEIVSAWSVLLAVAAPALVQLATLAFYSDISYGPRFLVAAFPGAIAIPAALVLDRWIGALRFRRLIGVGGLVLPLAVASPVLHLREAEFRATLNSLPAALVSLPAGSVVVTGRPCPAILLVETQLAVDPVSRGRTADWHAVCPGWAWPASLESRLDEALSRGQMVVLDLRDASWIGDEQRRALAEVKQYGGGHDDAVRVGAIRVWR